MGVGLPQHDSPIGQARIVDGNELEIKYARSPKEQVRVFRNGVKRPDGHEADCWVGGLLPGELREADTPVHPVTRLRALTFAADHTFTEAVANESAQMARTGQTADHAAAVAAFLAKEKPLFEGR